MIFLDRRAGGGQGAADRGAQGGELGVEAGAGRGAETNGGAQAAAPDVDLAAQEMIWRIQSHGASFVSLFQDIFAQHHPLNFLPYSFESSQ